MKKLAALGFTLALALTTLASPALFSKYESARQALLKSSLADVQKAATALAAEAKKAKNVAVARQADAVANSADLKAARAAFAALSDEMIKVRATAGEAKPAVYYCSMVNKSWLQPKEQVGNPYDASMAMCGELKAE